MVKNVSGTISLLKANWLITIVTLITVLFVAWVQVLPMAGSGYFDRNGSLLFDQGATFHDAGVHLSLISEMEYRFPPTNFALGGVPLKNYHYLYDVILALVHKVIGVSVFDLYYRIAPFIISLVLSAAIYLTVWRLTKNRWAAILAIFLAVMSTSLGSISPYLKIFLPGHAVSASNNLFMSDQIYDMMVNPHGVLALALFLFLFLSLSYYREHKNIRYLVIFSFLLGISFGIKAYGGVVFAISALILLVLFLIKKDHKAVTAIFIGLGFMAAWFLWTTDRSIVGLQFAPLWFLDRFMSDYEHLYQGDFPVLIKLYLAANNWWHPLFLYLQAFVIYLVGSLGLRLFGLIPIILALKKLRDPEKVPPELIFLASVAAVSFVMPLVFSQSSKPFDIIQFLPYFTLSMGIAFTIFVFKLTSQLPKGLAAMLIIFLLTISLAMDRHELSQRLTPIPQASKIVLGAPLLAATDYIQTQTPPDSVILLAPTRPNLDDLWFTSVSGRRTVLSGEFFSMQVGGSYLPVKNGVQKIFQGQSADIKFDYLFLRTDEKLYFDKIDKRQYQLRPVFKNGAAVIYQRV